MSLRFIVFSKPDFCPQCNHAKSYLSSKGVDFEVDNVYESELAAELISSKGYTSAPVIAIVDSVDGTVVDSCAGFNPRELNGLIDTFKSAPKTEKELVAVGAGTASAYDTPLDNELWDF